MKRISFFILAAILLSGCGVSRMKAVNWNPYNDERGSIHYQCLQEAQQSESRAAFAVNQYGGSGGAYSGAKTNKDLLDACMHAKGYELRPLTNTELVITLVTLPITIPTAIILLEDWSEFY